MTFCGETTSTFDLKQRGFIKFTAASENVLQSAESCSSVAVLGGAHRATVVHLEWRHVKILKIT